MAFVSPEPNTGCWLWMGTVTAGGADPYGRFWNGRMAYAHRVSFELFKGPIPEGLVIDHLCRTPACVRPEHLEAVTPKENTRRAVRT